MVRFGAWLLFVLACVLPGVYLRDIAAAEAQIRGYDDSTKSCLFTHSPSTEQLSPYGPPQHRRSLGWKGQEHLWSVFCRDRDANRSMKAYVLVGDYLTADVADRFIEALASSNGRVSYWATHWVNQYAHSRGVRDCLREMEEARFLRVLRSCPNEDVVCRLIEPYMAEQPEAGERVAAQWVREATDGNDVLTAFMCLPVRDDSDAEERRASQTVRAVLSAGLENPDEEVRRTCWVMRDMMDHPNDYERNRR